MSEKFSHTETLHDKNDIPAEKPQFMRDLTLQESRALLLVYFTLMRKEDVEKLTYEERAHLREIGHYLLNIKKNAYDAVNAFEMLQDYEELRNIADQLLQERPDSADLMRALILLEDHEGIRDLLNHHEDREDVSYMVGNAFIPFRKDVFAYVDQFLQDNNTPVSTGRINEGIDQVAIRNLVQEYDIAVPIARGGLKQGAIAHLYGMPTRIIDIAAHNRKVPRGKWINPITPEDFTGKRVLLFDKDAVSGASVRKTVDMLSQFDTAHIGIYFTHNVASREDSPYGTRTSGLPQEISLHFPETAPLHHAGDIYIETHEKLGTLYGRRRLLEQKYTKEIEDMRDSHPQLSRALDTFITTHLHTFDTLNPKVAGITELREQILSRLQNVLQDHQERLHSGLYNMSQVPENIIKVWESTPLLPLEFESHLINARYKKRGEEMAHARNIENPHNPHNPLAAFNAAQKAAHDGVDLALIVGPEGFAYEPYFHDLGVQTIAVNIPESGADEQRTITLYDDLTIVQNKNILVVEDDVRTGATLHKILEHLKPHTPEKINLYLGQAKSFQIMTNVPQEFATCYVADSDDPQASEKLREFLLTKGIRIFKNI